MGVPLDKLRRYITFAILALNPASSFLPSKFNSKQTSTKNLASPLNMQTLFSKETSNLPSWSDIQAEAKETTVGKALEEDAALRKQGLGSPQVQNTLRLFDAKSSDTVQITLFRDHAGWCPYCQKTMLLIEEKNIPIHISLVPMRSYGDKPREFLQKVPNGLLPAIEVNGKVITESQVIMELLDRWHTPEEGFKPMLPADDNQAGLDQYDRLAKLERQLFSWWCTLIFRPEGGLSGGGNPFNFLGGGGGMSGAMQGFMECLQQVDKALLSTKGPWFFGEYDYPTMIDFVYVSHVERILASCAYWKGLNLRDPKWKLKGLNRWIDAFEKREGYFAFKSDYYTHIKDIPPQYGPGWDGGFEEDRKTFSSLITGKGQEWRLPLPHDDPLQPLYRGPPLPVPVLEAVGLTPDSEGTYKSADPATMEKACRQMAAWKISGNGEKIAGFAARGGPQGSKNPRKSFGAPLADPYADPDKDIQSTVDGALRVVCAALLDVESSPDEYAEKLLQVVPENTKGGVMSSFAYLRDRIGVPRDLPLASARYMRAYLNWGIDTLAK